MKKLDFSNTVSKTGTFLSENKKPLLYIGGAVVVTILGIAVVKSLKGGVDNIFSFGNKDVKRDTAFNDEPIDATKVTITPQRAATYANNLYNAMKDSGSNESVIKDILNNINGEDYKLIYNAFNRRSYFWVGEPGWSNWLFGGYVNLDLNEWFKKEIDKLTDPVTYALIKKRANEAGFSF